MGIGGVAVGGKGVAVGGKGEGVSVRVGVDVDVLVTGEGVAIGEQAEERHIETSVKPGNRIRLRKRPKSQVFL